MKAGKLVNENSKSELTIEKLRSYKGFENVTDEEALIHIENIKELARILYGSYARKHTPGNARQ